MENLKGCDETSYSGLPEEADHGYTMQYPKGLSKKKINKTKKFQASLNINQQLLKGINTRTDLMEVYYEKKIKYMDQQMLHNKNMELIQEKKITAIENHTVIMSKLLATIANKN